MTDKHMKLLVGQLMPAFYGIFDLQHQKNVSFTFDDTINEELVTNLVKAIWIKNYFIRQHWVPYFIRFKMLMQKEPYDYLKYIMYACYLVSDHTEHIFERFLDVYSTVMTLTVLFKWHVHDVYLRYSPHIFTVYFDLHLKKPFYRCGGWKRLRAYLPRQDYVKCFEGLNGISITMQVLSEGNSIRRTVESIASRKKGPPYKPEKISQYNIDIHEETKFLTSWIIQSFVNEEFVGGKSSDPIAIAEIENSLCSVSNICFTKSKVLHLNVPNHDVVENNLFYQFCIDLQATDSTDLQSTDSTDLQSTDSDLENKCLRELKKKSLVRFASSYYMKNHR
ncbi:hypothetical protein CDAR_420931 [Caerostris darwini]|uniref:LAGLIDADG homing endonuclease n=1 Tax=Caerostris darwini TaxID=1538125 RepID=A0AAV4PL42_9ARAC|nr:hypothetical protein CDAR_420931 [Caerostris darwini]